MEAKPPQPAVPPAEQREQRPAAPAAVPETEPQAVQETEPQPEAALQEEESEEEQEVDGDKAAPAGAPQACLPTAGAGLHWPARACRRCPHYCAAAALSPCRSLPCPCPLLRVPCAGAYRSEGTRHLPGWTHFRPAEAEQPMMLVPEQE